VLLTDLLTVSLGRSTVRLLNMFVVELLKTKCLPVLTYGLEVCSLSKAQIRSLDYIYANRGRCLKVGGG